MRAAAPLLALVLAGGAAAETLYVEAARVLPIEGAPVAEGRLVIEDGTIAELGKDVKRPPFSRRIDARGLTVTPGFVVAATRLSLPGADAPEGRSGSEVRVPIEAGSLGAAELDPLDADLAFALRHGVTTLGLLPPGDEPGIPGQVSAITTRPLAAKAMTLQEDAALLVRVASHEPWRKAVGDAFEAAAKAVREADEKKDAAKKDGKEGGKKDGDRAKDPLQRALRRQEPCLVAVGSPAGWVAAQDVLPLDRLDVTIVDAFDLWPLADEVAKAKLRVLTWPALVREPRTRYPLNRAAVWEKAKVPYAFLLPLDTPRGAQWLREAAIEMHRTGCTREGVLRALTLEGAKALGLADKVGSIQKGRRADLLFWSGDPLDPATRLEFVLVGGERIDPYPPATLAEASP